MSKKLALILDDGHGMETPGKRSPITNMRENDFNRAVVSHMVTICKACNLLYKEVAPTDIDTPLSVRTKSANDWYSSLKKQYGANNIICVYLSIHANAGGGYGAETWVHSKATSDTVALGAKISAELAKLGLRNRGVKKGYTNNPKDNYAVNRDTNMTSVLIEHAFMDTKEDAAKLLDYGFRCNCAIADITAVMRHYGFNVSKVADALATKPPQPSDKLYRVQLGAFSDKNNAQHLVDELKGKGYHPIIV